MRTASCVSSIIKSSHLAPWKLQEHRLHSIFRNTAGRKGRVAQRKPTPEKQMKTATSDFLWSSCSTFHVLAENLKTYQKQKSALLHSTPDMPRTPVQKTWVGPEFYILISTLGDSLPKVLRYPPPPRTLPPVPSDSSGERMNSPSNTAVPNPPTFLKPLANAIKVLRLLSQQRYAYTHVARR